MSESAEAAAYRKARRHGLHVIIAAFVFIWLIVAAIVYVAVERRARRPEVADLALQLCDPDSMRTRGVVASNGVVFGEVNARGPMGGYEGFRPFYARHGRATVVDPTWPALCPQWPEATWARDHSQPSNGVAGGI